MNRDEANFEDLLNQSEVKDFLHHAEQEMFPKMKASVMSLVINADQPDAKLALEVGAAVLFNKPLLIVCLKGSEIPEMLRRIAHSIVEVEDFGSEESRKKLEVAVKAILKDVRP